MNVGTYKEPHPNLVTPERKDFRPSANSFTSMSIEENEKPVRRMVLP